MCEAIKAKRIKLRSVEIVWLSHIQARQCTSTQSLLSFWLTRRLLKLAPMLP